MLPSLQAALGVDVPSKDAILAALVNEAIAAFQDLPDPPPATDLPAAELLELIGTAFVHTVTAQLELLTILVSEHHALADDCRFAEFIHHVAVNLGHLLDRMTGPDVHASGYLTARAYMGSLIAFVIAQDVLGLSAIQPLDPTEYVRHLATLTARGLNATPEPGTR